MSDQPRPPLLLLALVTFVVGTDGFVIAGLLPQIAADLHVTPALAGQLVTAFALTFAVAAVVLSAVTGAWDRGRVMIIGLCVLAAASVGTALAPNFPLALLGRIVAALGASVLTSAAASTTAALVAPERRGRALSVVMGGLISASAIGVPLGLLIGLAGWRATLVAIGVLAFGVAIAIARRLPPVRLPSTSLASRLAPLGRPAVLRVAGATSPLLCAMYAVHTYAAVLLAPTHPEPWMIIAALTGFGIASVIGNAIAGRLVDRRPAWLVIGAVAIGLIAVDALGTFTLGSGIGSTVWIVALALFGGAITVPQQLRLLRIDPTAAPALLALNSTAIYVGAAAGGALGGLALTWSPPAVLGAAALSAAAGLLLIIADRPWRDEAPRGATAPAASGRAA
ncbi:putative MFS family arabinose efflux permease [Naumannella cuiyingiana]|uniref:Putative MFS family arabinose efflux permease n=1 Tax=Naumannella cuiyingiana TaxID=1347891 RepID=A0A7Z0DC34_9ACTN|nr:MFS transporter [Naumannella cuiyingiana]NYI72568.1 putative MFS family arabinose efflux permease [Naumannella cuiyingiana]